MLMLKYIVPVFGCAFISLAATAQTQCADRDANIVGVAVNEKTQEFLYCEQYYQLDNVHWRVDYNDGEVLIVQKSLDYSLGDESPIVVQEDLRTGELRSVDINDDGASWHVQYRPKATDTTQKKDIIKAKEQVIDAGFDAFVREKWSEVTAGNAVVFNFLSIPHLRAIPLRAMRTAMDDCDALNVKLDDGVCIRVEANNRLLRFFVDRLTLLYDTKRRLRAFNGPVNIQNSEGETQKATIVYRYKNDKAI